MTPSPLDAARDAYDHTRRDLFPFRFDRWLPLGLVAFLDECGRAGGQAGLHVTPPGITPPMGTAPPELDHLGEWVGAHLALIVLAAVVLITLLLALTALVLWVNSRGVFMYIDDVSTGRADVSRPWSAHAERASSYFAWSFGLAVGLLLAMFGLLAVGAVTVLAVIRQGLVSGVMVTGLLALMVPVFALLLLAGVLASIGLRDFVAPLQWQADVPCGAAVNLVVALVKANPGPFVVYLLLKFALAIAVAIVLAVAGCLTCCLGLLPIVRQTLFQPVFYFERAWSLHFLRRLGYDLVSRGAESDAPPGGGA